MQKKLTEKVDIHKKQIHYVDLWNVIFGIHFLYLKLLASATFRSINALASTQLPKYIFKNCIILYMFDYIRRLCQKIYITLADIQYEWIMLCWYEIVSYSYELFDRALAIWGHKLWVFGYIGLWNNYYQTMITTTRMVLYEKRYTFLNSAI